MKTVMKRSTSLSFSATVHTPVGHDLVLICLVDTTNFYPADGICGFIQNGKTCWFKCAYVEEIKEEKRREVDMPYVPSRKLERLLVV